MLKVAVQQSTPEQTRLLKHLKASEYRQDGWTIREALFYGDKPFDLETLVSVSRAGWVEEQGSVLRLSAQGEVALSEAEK